MKNDKHFYELFLNIFSFFSNFASLLKKFLHTQKEILNKQNIFFFIKEIIFAS